MNLAIHYAIRRELRRLGAEDLGGIASGGGVTASDTLAWLRSLPSGLGLPQLLARLDGGQGPVPGVGAHMPPRDPTFHTPDLDLEEGLFTQLDRLLRHVPDAKGWAIDGPYDKAAAVRALSALPDNAGWDAIAAVVPIFRVVET